MEGGLQNLSFPFLTPPITKKSFNSQMKIGCRRVGAKPTANDYQQYPPPILIFFFFFIFILFNLFTTLIRRKQNKERGCLSKEMVSNQLFGKLQHTTLLGFFFFTITFLTDTAICSVNKVGRKDEKNSGTIF